MARDRPTVSVVTPSFNQAQFLPACLASVATQTHAAIEHLVFDPGSSDGSRDIAGAASVVLIAEPDRGQSHAVGLGFERATGDVIAWLNADDCLADENVLAVVADRFAQDDRPDIVYGGGQYVNTRGVSVEPGPRPPAPSELRSTFSRGVGLLQPATFLHRRVVAQIGVPDPALRYAMDYEYWMRAFDAGLRFVQVPEVLAHATVHPQAKTVDERADSLTEAEWVSTRRNGWLADSWARRVADYRLTGADGMFTVTRPDSSDFEAVILAARRLLWERNVDLRSGAALLRDVLARNRAAAATLAFMLGRTPTE